MLKDKIKSLAKAYKEEVIQNRRHLHSHPELSYQEYETAKFVKSKLEEIGIESLEQKATTGWTALIKGKNPDKKVIALRADMDALPIIEANEVPYKSQNPGVMHACGHDAHTASLLGAAKILNEVKDQFEGTIKLIFQPGEEVAPGGASYMIKDGALNNPRPNGIIGQHVMPFIPAGKVGFRQGIYMASADELYVTVKGKGGHGAMPETLIDPVLIASHMIVALQQVISRAASPKIPSVLSFGRVEALGATNVIPNEVKIQGTFRTLNEEWRAKAHQKMLQIAKGIVEGMGGEVDFEIRKGYPFLQNDPELTARATDAAKEYLGEENVIDLDIWMAAEDFAYYSQEIDGCFYRLGTRNEDKGIVSGVHTPTFDIEEDALEIGAGLMAWLAVAELQKA
ncbi:MAG TPA: amidohydrolase [Algoriphagus sp.]|jgi:amidohydrolase|uniref:Amidohydrolase n=1 Tax=Algoriphagus ornithinivorans TaxID=226506 RepID=A0A1I5G2N8_9BACT|nr:MULTISPECIES: M20 family metallopeptidase [Algoriphagus]MAL12145.1 amidohydrolase [Algoriphagus sp.]MAN87006.1 amidohydrolase [Algoriphagus sp.]SFO30275.1 amidohydrolase [Algoriphagus ornithinivorans]HAD52291.1 amidohydrolase [Algoriphagus sp.]HAS59640.1 amidohydrolase [Algoriphagus sp.]|tara:strand:+ start:4739 stop:5929 length:1191 start_codon:yes stop_codon:yes gene_type:complete